MAWISSENNKPEVCCKLLALVGITCAAAMLPAYMANLGTVYLAAQSATKWLPTTPCPGYTTAGNTTDLPYDTVSLCGMGNDAVGAEPYMVRQSSTIAQFYDDLISSVTKPAMNAPTFNTAYGLAAVVLGVGVLATVYHVNKKESAEGQKTQHAVFALSAFAATAGALAVMFNMPASIIPGSIALATTAAGVALYTINQKANPGEGCIPGRAGIGAIFLISAASIGIGIYALVMLSSADVNSSFLTQSVAHLMGCKITDTGPEALSEQYNDNWFCSENIHAGNLVPLTTLVNGFTLMIRAPFQIATAAVLGATLVGTMIYLNCTATKTSKPSLASQYHHSSGGGTAPAPGGSNGEA
jgi:hypothetical protein